MNVPSAAKGSAKRPTQRASVKKPLENQTY
jgi:hypothetical protein